MCGLVSLEAGLGASLGAVGNGVDASLDVDFDGVGACVDNV